MLWSQQVLTTGRLRAVVLNSGGANACTGPGGFQDTHKTAEELAAALSNWGTETGAVEVAVCSTGLIGDRLPMDKVLPGVTEIVHELARRHLRRHRRRLRDHDHRHRAQAGRPASRRQVERRRYGQGCGHARPVAGHHAQRAHHRRRRRPPSNSTEPCARPPGVTFDRLDVDGSCSTNDTVLLLSSGASGITPTQDELDAAVLAVCDDLAEQLMADAEGVTKRVTVTVTGATTEDDALTAARTVARDSLVKTALFGSDPNWGRVLAAVGMAPVELDPERISVSFNGSPVCVDGVGAPGARAVDLSGADIAVEISLGVGDAQASIRTTDLSHGYVEENSAYSS